MSLPLQPSEIFLVYAVFPNETTGESRRLVGKFMIHEGQFNVLGDYAGILAHFKEGPVSEDLFCALEALADSPYYDIVTKEELLSGARIDLIPELTIGQNPNGNVGQAQDLFEYQHQNDAQPSLVSITPTGMVVGSKPADPDQIAQMLAFARSGNARISYSANLQKSLAPADSVKQDHLSEAMQELKALVDSGQIHPHHFDTIRKELFTDEMVPSIGNKRAYNDHVSRNNNVGTHIMLDANNFKAINDELSHQHGDQAIKSFGQAIRDAVDHSVGSDSAKVHRFGGDEFHIHAQSPEHAHVILRTLRDKLDALPPVGGTHKLSMSAGIGPSVELADHALNTGAKGMKAADMGLTGSTRPNKSLYVHSMVPGQEGPVPHGDPNALPAGVLPSAPHLQKPAAPAST